MLIHGRYQVETQLGEGAFGITYLVRDTKVPGKPKRVLKQLKVPTDQSQKVQDKVKSYFEREAEKLGELGVYDQIPNIFDYFQEQDEIYLVQEFVQGQSLASELHKKRLSEPQTLQLLQEILTPLAIVHKHNVIHRDLKPDNIIRRQRDKKLVLIDFGAVKTLQNDPKLRTQSPQSTWAIGTPGYMPDEQYKGHPRFCSDVYAVGMIAVQALTGIPPYSLPYDPDTLERDWQSRVQVSPQMRDFIGKMVRYDFRQRYGNAQEALEVLLDLTYQTPQPQPTPVAPSVLNPPQPQSPKPPPKPQTPQATPKPPPKPQSAQSTPVKSGSSLTRRRVLQLTGLGGAGLIGVLVINRLSSQSLTDAEIQELTTISNILPEAPTGKTFQAFDFETVTVNDRGEEIDRQAGQAEYFTEDLGNGVSLEMVAIPGGTFVMGSPEDEGADNERPQHQVTVQPFFLGRYQVTQAQWQAVMGNNPASFKGDNRPVESVSWNEAVEFCEKLSQATGREYRLPSESQWEYACRAGTTTPFHFGETITTNLVNYDGNFTYANAPEGEDREETTPVGSFLPNAFGLYDMHGNVGEWCEDVWHDSYNGAPTDGSTWNLGGEQDRRVLRGGSWNDIPRSCRSADRNYFTPGYRNNLIGFRVLCAVVPGLL